MRSVVAKVIHELDTEKAPPDHVDEELPTCYAKAAFMFSEGNRFWLSIHFFRVVNGNLT